MTRLMADLHAVHGDYQVAIGKVNEEPGPQVTLRGRLVPEPGRGQPLTVRTVYIFRGSLIASIEIFPAKQHPAGPERGREDSRSP